MTSLLDTVTCLFNKGPAGDENPANDCANMARWHIQYTNKTHTQSCDGHLGRALRWRESKYLHEFGAACNLPGSWYDGELGACYTEEHGLELGLLRRVDG